MIDERNHWQVETCRMLICILSAERLLRKTCEEILREVPSKVSGHPIVYTSHVCLVHPSTSNERSRIDQLLRDAHEISSIMALYLQELQTSAASATGSAERGRILATLCAHGADITAYVKAVAYAAGRLCTCGNSPAESASDIVLVADIQSLRENLQRLRSLLLILVNDCTSFAAISSTDQMHMLRKVQRIIYEAESNVTFPSQSTRTNAGMLPGLKAKLELILAEDNEQALDTPSAKVEQTSGQLNTASSDAQKTESVELDQPLGTTLELSDAEPINGGNKASQASCKSRERDIPDWAHPPSVSLPSEFNDKWAIEGDSREIAIAVRFDWNIEKYLIKDRKKIPWSRTLGRKANRIFFVQLEKGYYRAYFRHEATYTSAKNRLDKIRNPKIESDQESTTVTTDDSK